MRRHILISAEDRGPTYDSGSAALVQLRIYPGLCSFIYLTFYLAAVSPAGAQSPQSSILRVLNMSGILSLCSMRGLTRRLLVSDHLVCHLDGSN